MPNLITIACVGANREIGNNNDLIWKFHEDLQTFKQITMGSPMVMGLNTYRSLPGILPGRQHLVISDQPFDHPPEVLAFGSIPDFLAHFKAQYKDIFVIGGGMIYRQLLPHSDKLILTEVDATCPDAVIFFPEFDKNEWIVEKSEDFIDPKSKIKYTRNFYKRKAN